MNLPLTFELKPRLSAMLAAGFILATTIGTVSHEAGHYLVMNGMGFNPSLHYATTSYGESIENNQLISYYESNKAKIHSPGRSQEKEHFNQMSRHLDRKFFYCTLGGPIQTIITGTLGFVLLWTRRKKILARGSLRLREWFFLFLAFFWSRQLANFLTGAYYFMRGGKSSGDEDTIARYLNLPNWIIEGAGALVAFILILWIIFFVIPKQQRLTFIFAGGVGSLAGALIWFGWLGPTILP